MLDNLGYRHVKIGRFGFFVDPISGRVLPEVRGGADGDPDDNPDTPRVFTQEEVNRMTGTARREARQAAANELAEQLGCTVEEAKAAIDAKSQADDAAKTEAQRLADQAAADRQAAATEKAEAARERLAAKVERKLAAAGVGQGIADDADGAKAAAAIARAARMLELKPDASDDDVTAEVDALKADMPALFTPATEETDTSRPGKPAPKAPAKPASPSTGAKSMAELGQETLRKAGLRPRQSTAA